MAIGTGIAMLIGSGIAAATQLYGASRAAKAAKDAAQTQSAAANQAMALQQQMYNQNAGYLMPWVQQGQSAATALSGLMGLPTGGMAGGGGEGTGGTPVGDQTLYGGPGTAHPYQASDIVGRAVPRSMTATPRSMTATMRPSQGTVARTQTASSYVRMRAPTGEVSEVPVEMIPHFRERGAVLLD